MIYLVTGGAGFIGSHLCKFLNRNGHTVIAIDDLSRGHKRFAGKWGPFIHADIADTSVLKDTFNKYEIDGVFHLAGYAYVGESVEKPELYHENNYIKSQILFEQLELAKINRVIFSSTCSVYGNVATDGLINEKTLCRPSNPYGQSKLLTEKLLISSSFKYGILRYFNAAGSDSEGEIGECHNPQYHLIPLVIKAALDPNYVLNIFGDNYHTIDGTCVRDYIHVEDLALIHLRAMKLLEVENNSFIVNLGTSKGYSVLEIINLVEKILGKKVKRNITKARLGDPASLVADVSLMQHKFGISLKELKTVEQMIVSTYNWMIKEI